MNLELVQQTTIGLNQEEFYNGLEWRDSRVDRGKYYISICGVYMAA